MASPPLHIARLGGKSTDKTKQLNIYDEAKSLARDKGDWGDIKASESISEALKQKLVNALPENYATSRVTIAKLLDHLEFEDVRYFEAFQIPDDGDMNVVGKKGKGIGPYYLFEQWRDGKNAGALNNHAHVLSNLDVWNKPLAQRRALISRWTQDVLQDEADVIATLIIRHNKKQDEKAAILSRNTVRVMQSKRIIACTTTAAAKYRADIHATRPSILLVEEAGEILESHLITAMGSSVKQLILIGDHKQLRPKCNNFELTVEVGKGFDLNRSLFERLVLQDFPHHTLSLQHRMRPEISAFVRQLTYPDLADAPKTSNRPDIKGLQHNVIFIDHTHNEDASKADAGANDRSRTNEHEAEMVLKIVKYLGQQGYGTDKLVLLTPYLGQLSLLRNKLSHTLDPVLNDLDSYDLVQAGLIPVATARSGKNQIRLATIGTYLQVMSQLVSV